MVVQVQEATPWVLIGVFGDCADGSPSAATGVAQNSTRGGAVAARFGVQVLQGVSDWSGHSALLLRCVACRCIAGSARSSTWSGGGLFNGVSERRPRQRCNYLGPSGSNSHSSAADWCCRYCHADRPRSSSFSSRSACWCRGSDQTCSAAQYLFAADHLS